MEEATVEGAAAREAMATGREGEVSGGVARVTGLGEEARGWAAVARGLEEAAGERRGQAGRRVLGPLRGLVPAREARQSLQGGLLPPGAAMVKEARGWGAAEMGWEAAARGKEALGTGEVVRGGVAAGRVGKEVGAMGGEVAETGSGEGARGGVGEVTGLEEGARGWGAAARGAGEAARGLRRWAPSRSPVLEPVPERRQGWEQWPVSHHRRAQARAPARQHQGWARLPGSRRQEWERAPPHPGLVPEPEYCCQGWALQLAGHRWGRRPGPVY